MPGAEPSPTPQGLRGLEHVGNTSETDLKLRFFFSLLFSGNSKEFNLSLDPEAAVNLPAFFLCLNLRFQLWNCAWHVRIAHLTTRTRPLSKPWRLDRQLWPLPPQLTHRPQAGQARRP